MGLKQSEWIHMLRWIALFRQEHGYSPTVREIGAGIGIQSTSNVVYRINRLTEMGYITHEPRLPRTIRITRDGEEAMKLHKNLVREADEIWRQAQKNSRL